MIHGLKHIFTKFALRYIGVLVIAFVLASCSSTASTPPAQSTPKAPTAASTPSGTVLYQADWSKGLEDWHATSGWKITQNELVSEMKGDHGITIPYMVTASAYSIEVRLKVVNAMLGGAFVFRVEPTSDKDGYSATIAGIEPPGYKPKFNSVYPEALVTIRPSDDQQNTSVVTDHIMDNDWHIYRIDVRPGHIVGFYSDGVRMSVATGNKPIAGGPILIQTTTIQATISSIRIVTL
ncbi:MAG: hypothetical protein J2P37_26520 [Ktedonobacteraceae bacterium]|nr:hypothetical protein [Ktedonobacteraceae bacterium]MBO0790196.1 hypothetical protein [Ktedonobacteraceae bacterium]